VIHLWFSTCVFFASNFFWPISIFLLVKTKRKRDNILEGKFSHFLKLLLFYWKKYVWKKACDISPSQHSSRQWNTRIPNKSRNCSPHTKSTSTSMSIFSCYFSSFPVILCYFFWHFDPVWLLQFIAVGLFSETKLPQTFPGSYEISGFRKFIIRFMFFQRKPAMKQIRFGLLWTCENSKPFIQLAISLSSKGLGLVDIWMNNKLYWAS
jgi:hypothetical protein